MKNSIISGRALYSYDTKGLFLTVALSTHGDLSCAIFESLEQEGGDGSMTENVSSATIKTGGEDSRVGYHVEQRVWRACTRVWQC
jgi:hypothetical protein